ncbi:hypothetical protein K504DRAFT_457213 [Pleomassaria siparia CBS 279.74]|uniref:Uncharacterized protein n=1 Tax=Pleomassaria siparia CBS 279.74 TaxID=1314801 RepID=A0A6G1KQZ1_9PLEO|nr:hypothetical protein K504DRAFT_457213 [Pleomassaria siparia CBS 279.74]
MPDRHEEEQLLGVQAQNAPTTKANVARTNSAHGTSHSTGLQNLRPVASEEKEDKQPPRAMTKKPQKTNFLEIMSVVEKGYIVPPTGVFATVEKGEEEEGVEEKKNVIDEDDSFVPEYNLEQPLILGLSLPEIMAKVNALNDRRTEREATNEYEHNPFILEHLFSGAPYTKSLCKKCTTDRSCRVHRLPREERTSISLCSHTYMNLFWAPNDPVNTNGSWKLEIRDYYLDDEKEKAIHRQCQKYRPSERVELLTQRLTKDLQNERITRAEQMRGGDGKVRGVHGALRGSTRRARKELHALVGAYEAAKVRQEIAAEQKKSAEQKLADMIRRIRHEEEQRKAKIPQTRYKFSEVEEGEIAENVEAVKVAKKARIEEKEIVRLPMPDYGREASPFPECKASVTLEPAVQGASPISPPATEPSTPAIFIDSSTEVSEPGTLEPEVGQSLPESPLGAELLEDQVVETVTEEDSLSSETITPKGSSVIKAIRATRALSAPKTPISIAPASPQSSVPASEPRSPTPEPATPNSVVPATPIVSVSGSLANPDAESFGYSPTSSSNKLKRSSDGDNVTLSRSKRTKKVNFTPEIEAAPIVHKPRLMSIHEAGAWDEIVEDEVDHDVDLF